MVLAHGNRRITKAPSGTMSSDDLDEREMGTVYEGGESSCLTSLHHSLLQTILMLLTACLVLCTCTSQASAYTISPHREPGSFVGEQWVNGQSAHVTCGPDSSSQEDEEQDDQVQTV